MNEPLSEKDLKYAEDGIEGLEDKLEKAERRLTSELLKHRVPLDKRFGLLQQVTIIPLRVKGYVEAIMLDGTGTMYKVAYWWEGERKSAWCLETELEAEAEREKRREVELTKASQSGNA